MHFAIEGSQVKLKEFIILAKKKGYASGEAKKRLPDGSRRIEFKKGAYSYVDKYKGSREFGGKETVKFEGKPVWEMEYNGKVFGKEKKHEEIYSFLRECLRRVPESAPYRGPKSMRIGKLEYENDWNGNIALFKGKESILENGKKVYSLKYSGKELVKK